MAMTSAVLAQHRRRRAANSPARGRPAPILENGDALTRAEFERRYARMPHLKKAELLEGVVFMSAAVRYGHGKPHGRILLWLGAYGIETPGVDCADNVTVRLDDENEVQPDALLRLEEGFGGQSRLSDDDYIEGPPELIVEVASSRVSYDLRQKFEVYRRHGVKEYLVWRVDDNALDWFALQNGEYAALASDADGLLRSRVFPGLWLSVDALLSDDMKTVLRVLRDGLAERNGDGCSA